VAAPTGFARGLERALGLEPVQLEVPDRMPGAVLLLNPRRLEILLAAAAYPGVHLRSASRLLLSPLPSLRFHVEKLRERGLLRTWKSGRRLHLYVPGMYPPRFEPFLATWEDPLQRRVLALIWDHPGIERRALRRQLITDAGVLSRALGPLLERDAIRESASRRGTRYRTTAGWNSFDRACRDRTGERLQRFLSLLRAEGLRPLLEEMAVDRARISVDGPRFRVRFSLPLDPLRRDAKASPRSLPISGPAPRSLP